MYIWLDDMRQPPPNTLWAKTAKDVINFLTSYNPEQESLYIDLDHDLGTKMTGYDLCKWLIQQPYIGKFHIHSMNPVGRQNMYELLIHYGWQPF